MEVALLFLGILLLLSFVIRCQQARQSKHEGRFMELVGQITLAKTPYEYSKAYKDCITFLTKCSHSKVDVWNEELLDLMRIQQGLIFKL